MEDQRLRKVFHSPYEDVLRIVGVTGCNPVNVFDTQLAAAFFGNGRNVSYVDFVCGWFNKFFNKDKAVTCSIWSNYPLTAAQIEYARMDVIPLYYAYQKMMGYANSIT